MKQPIAISALQVGEKTTFEDILRTITPALERDEPVFVFCPFSVTGMVKGFIVRRPTAEEEGR